MEQYPHFYFSQCFHDFEAYKSMASRRNLDFKKVSAGTFAATIKMIDLGSVQLAKSSLTGTIHQQGLTPKGYRTFVLPVNQYQRYFWLGRTVTSENLLLFPKNNILESVSHEGFHVYTIAIHEEYLQNLIASSEYLHLEKKISSSEIAFTIDKNFLVYINSFIEAIFALLDTKKSTIQSKKLQHSVLNKLPKILLDYLNANEFSSVNKYERNRDLKIEAAVKYIYAHATESISIPSLSKRIGVSERSLEYGIKERFAVTPKQFIKSYKLNRIHENLYKSKTQIQKIARQYGFNHLSQFAADYKQQFDELPSETLAKKFQIS